MWFRSCVWTCVKISPVVDEAKKLESNYIYFNAVDE